MTRLAGSRSKAWQALLVVLLVLAAGCLGRPAPRERSFRLQLAKPARLSEPVLSGILEVDRLRASALARGTALVYVQDASSPELLTSNDEHWVDSPTLLLQREMAAYLDAAGIADRVLTPELGLTPDHRLTGELVRFEEQRAEGGARVVVELALVLSDERRRAVLLQHRYREERAVEGRGAADAVRGYAEAVSAILARFVADAGARP